MIIRIFFCSVICMYSAVAFANVGEDVDLKDERQRNSYMIGLDLARGISQIKDEIDINTVLLVMSGYFDGGESRITPEEERAIRTALEVKLKKFKK